MSVVEESTVERTMPVETCDLCGGSELHEVADAGTLRCRIVMCRNCGLFFASPSLSIDYLESFYDDEFIGDPGTNVRVGQSGGGIEERKLKQERRLAEDWALPIIDEHLQIEGSRILDVRCRSGELAEALSRKGAHVTAIDPLEPNAQHAESRGTIEEVRFLPILQFYRLKENGLRDFDAVTALSIHTLGHMPSPRALLEQFYSVLKPGGMLFVDEKDVYYPERTVGPSVFDSGAPHYVHFTKETMRMYLESTGFEVVECNLDPQRKKAFRHIRTIARRPLTDRPVPSNGEIFSCDPEERLAKLADTEARLARKAGLNRMKRKTKAAVRKVLPV